MLRKTSEMKTLKISSFNQPYYIELDSYQNLIDTLIDMIDEAKENGLFSLEGTFSSSKHQLLKELGSMMLDGCQRQSIMDYGTSKIKWIIQECKDSEYLSKKEFDESVEIDKNKIIKKLQSIEIGDMDSKKALGVLSLSNNLYKKINADYPKNINKEEYVKSLEKELITILYAVLAIQNEQTSKDFNETLDHSAHDINELYLKNEKEISFDYLKELLSEAEKHYDQQIDSDIKLQDIRQLINTLVNYATLSRKDGIKAMSIASEKEVNPRIIEFIQKTFYSNKIEPTVEYVNEKLNILKSNGISDKKFLRYYEKELIAISCAMRKIYAGDAPRDVQLLLLSIYPEQKIEGI